MQLKSLSLKSIKNIHVTTILVYCLKICFFPEITQKDNFENFEKFPWTYLWLCRFLVNLQACNLKRYWEKDFFTNVFRVFPRNIHDGSDLRTVQIYDDAFFTRRLYFHYNTGFKHAVIFLVNSEKIY